MQENPTSVPSTHTGQLIVTGHLDLEGLITSSGLNRHLYPRGHAHTELESERESERERGGGTYTYINIYKVKKIFKTYVLIV